MNHKLLPKIRLLSPLLLIMCLSIWHSSSLASIPHENHAEELTFNLDSIFEITEFRNNHLGVLKKEVTQFYENGRRGNTPLVQSFMNTSQWLDDTVLSPGRFMQTNSEYLGNQSFTYDMATVTMVYTLFGEYRKAKEILDIYRDNFKVKKNGLYGLYNSYKTDDFDFFFPTVAGRRNMLVIGIDGNRIHAGPSIWVGLATQHFFMETGSPRYMEFMCEIFNWCRELNHFQFEDGSFGGISMGYGWGPDWQGIYATEHNIDYFAFVNNMRRIYQMNRGDIQATFKKKGITIELLNTEMKGTARWLQQAYNPRGTFNRGYNNFGPDESEALDLTSWGITSLTPDLLLALDMDPFHMVQRAEEQFQVTIQIDGKKFIGFDFTNSRVNLSYPQNNTKERTIWMEGTCQMIICYQVIADYYAKNGDYADEKVYRDKSRSLLNEVRSFAKFVGLPNSSLPYSSKRLREKETFYSFPDWWPLARGEKGAWVASTIGTSWRIFAELQFNAFDLFCRRTQPNFVTFDLDENEEPDNSPRLILAYSRPRAEK